METITNLASFRLAVRIDRILEMEEEEEKNMSYTEDFIHGVAILIINLYVSMNYTIIR
jgi:hypothetical protein